MDESAASPLLVALFFILRCMIPLVIMLGISYLLRRFGLVAETGEPPKEQEQGNSNPGNSTEGGMAHGKA